MSRDLLAALVGEWNGTYRLWLEPGTLRTEGPRRAVAAERSSTDGSWRSTTSRGPTSTVHSRAACCSA